MAEIALEHVSKRFGSFTAVDDLDLAFGAEEVTCLLGPSGCGKTTLMRMIAGLERPSTGRIRIAGRDVTGLPPRARDIGMVFQSPVMYPTLTAAENLAEPLRHDRKVDRAERDRRVDELLDVLAMRDMRAATMDELGSGHRQKVAVGRAVARHVGVVLFDEPTTGIETGAKLALIRAIRDVTRRLRQTVVYVTHDQTEAMTLADRIALMNAGRIVQYEAPRTLYAEPASRFAGWFLGNPGMNYIPVTAEGATVSAPMLARRLHLAEQPEGDLVVGVRPESVRLGEGAAEAEVLDRTIGTAGRRLVTLRLGETLIYAKGGADAAVEPGARVRVSVPAERAHVFAGERRIPLAGDPA